METSHYLQAVPATTPAKRAQPYPLPIPPHHIVWVLPSPTPVAMPCSRSLVGIAGEHDVDAPDLLPPEQQTPKPNEPQGGGNSRLNGGHLHAPLRAAGPRDGKFQSNPTETVLGPGAWAALRDRLLGELNELASGDDAALWAHRSLQDKNKLIAAGAHPGEDEPNAPGEPSPLLSAHGPHLAKQPKNGSPSKMIDKSVLVLPEPRRIWDRDHVRYVAKRLV